MAMATSRQRSAVVAVFEAQNAQSMLHTAAEAKPTCTTFLCLHADWVARYPPHQRRLSLRWSSVGRRRLCLGHSRVVSTLVKTERGSHLISQSVVAT